ncbi:hypothetical protein [uncultured Helicobacter sp.]|uniref:hypothetical protein n=1 Tax=uncultured Helicobacter sp. TaxID=175537 RepID=UPI00375057D9
MVYRKRTSPSGVPDAATLRSHRISLKSCMYARVSGARADSLRSSGNKFLPKQKLA